MGHRVGIDTMAKWAEGQYRSTLLAKIDSNQDILLTESVFCKKKKNKTLLSEEIYPIKLFSITVSSIPANRVPT